MKVFAIIAEYNPLHLGHIHQINTIKEKFPDAYIIVLISGSFVQRGEPSFISKYDKSKAAILNGVDLVLEMPVILSLQSADFFSKGAVNLLNKLNIVDYLSFGYEGDNIEELVLLARAEKQKINLINKLVAESMKWGNSYKESLDLARKEIFSDLYRPEYNLPNNTLAFQYIKTIVDENLKLNIYPIKRLGQDYHGSQKINNSQFASASYIRSHIRNGQPIDKLKVHLPEEIWNILINKPYRLNLDDYSSIFYYLSFIENKDPSSIAGYENGLLNLLKKNFHTSISSSINLSHNKRYSKARLRRFILNYILDIKKEDVNKIEQLNYISPIYFNNKGAYLIKMIKSKANLTVLQKPKDIIFLDSYNKKMAELDKKAESLYFIKKLDGYKLKYIHNPYIN